jgi:hypothetical protein
VYVYLDRLSNAFSEWGRSKPVEKSGRPATDHRSTKEAAE